MIDFPQFEVCIKYKWPGYIAKHTYEFHDKTCNTTLKEYIQHLIIDDRELAKQIDYQDSNIIEKTQSGDGFDLIQTTIFKIPSIKLTLTQYCDESIIETLKKIVEDFQ